MSVILSGELAQALVERAIGRELRQAETAIDVIALDSALERAKDDLERAIRDEMLDAAVEWLSGRMMVPSLRVTDKMLEPLDRLWELGRREAALELERLGYVGVTFPRENERAFARAPAPIDRDLERYLRNQLPGLSVRIEDELLHAELAGASRHAIAQALITAPGARDIASQVISTALISGLGATFEENADLILCWEYTAILDAATCAACRPFDGRKYHSLEALFHDLPNFGPNPRCLGGGRCRCRALPCHVDEAGQAEPEPEPLVVPDDLPPLAGDTADELADSLFRQAEAMDEPVTGLLEDVVTASGGRMEGLDFRLKARDSMARKIAGDADEKLVTELRAAGEIKDGLRYTAVFESDAYAAGVESIFAELEARGMVIDRVKNFWQKDGVYVGINAIVRAPNGYLFELQFHTPASFTAKQVSNHPIFELFRLEKDKDIRRALRLQMIGNSNRVPRPRGISQLGTPVS